MKPSEKGFSEFLSKRIKADPRSNQNLSQNNNKSIKNSIQIAKAEPKIHQKSFKYHQQIRQNPIGVDTEKRLVAGPSKNRRRDGLPRFLGAMLAPKFAHFSLQFPRRPVLEKYARRLHGSTIFEVLASQKHVMFTHFSHSCFEQFFRPIRNSILESLVPTCCQQV